MRWAVGSRMMIKRVLYRYMSNLNDLEECDHNDKYQYRAKREVKAVKTVLDTLPPIEQEIIRLRFFTDKNTRISYENIYNSGYSPRQIRRIVNKVIIDVGKELGEIRHTPRQNA